MDTGGLLSYAYRIYFIYQSFPLRAQVLCLYFKRYVRVYMTYDVSYLL